MEEYTIRSAFAEDAQTLSDIYGYYVTNTAVTFEITPPSAEEIAERIARYTQKYPYLVIEDDEDIIGFASAHAFRERPAYDFAAEVSIYLRHDARHQGYGKAVYTLLEQELARMGIHNLYACIATSGYPDDPYLSTDSPRFHAALGYRQCGAFCNCGRKFDRWYHMIWMEKVIREPCDHPAPLIPYPTLIRDTRSDLQKLLSSYDEKVVRLITKYGDLFYGEALHFCAEYGAHEFGREEEGLQLGATLCFLSEISHIEVIG